MISDNQLIQKSLNGDAKAFEKLVIRYQDKMYSLCFSILKNRGEAQEAAQDTFIKMHKSLDSYNATAKFSSWLYKIAYRTSLDYIRKRKSSTDIDQIESGVLVASENQARGLENNELAVLLNKVIEELPPDEAGLVRMFYLEELSVKEIEDITDLTISNVKVKLFRARKKLAEIAHEQYSEIEEYLTN